MMNVAAPHDHAPSKVSNLILALPKSEIEVPLRRHNALIQHPEERIAHTVQL